MLELSKEELKQVYAKLYSAKKVDHPAKGLLRPYGGDVKRNKFFLDFLGEKDEKREWKILDASCGRGHLLMAIKNAGWRVEATELYPHLIKELQGHGVVQADYEQLAEVFGENAFDVVISNDVLEHLFNFDAVRDALKQLAYVSRRWVLLSMGIGRAPKYPSALKIKGLRDLHIIQKRADWWREEVSKFLSIEAEFKTGSLFLFGRVP